MPEVDGFLGVNEYERLPEILSSIELSKDADSPARYNWVCGQAPDTLKTLPRLLNEESYTATLKI